MSRTHAFWGYAHEGFHVSKGSWERECGYVCAPVKLEDENQNQGFEYVKLNINVRIPAFHSIFSSECMTKRKTHEA